MRAGERELQAGGQRGARVEVVVGGADDLVDLREHGGHALRRRRWRGQEAQLAVALLLVRAVGDQTVPRVSCRRRSGSGDRGRGSGPATADSRRLRGPDRGTCANQQPAAVAPSCTPVPSNVSARRLGESFESGPKSGDRYCSFGRSCMEYQTKCLHGL